MLTGHLWDEHFFDRVGDFIRALTVESLEPNSAPLEVVAAGKCGVEFVIMGASVFGNSYRKSRI